MKARCRIVSIVLSNRWMSLHHTAPSCAVDMLSTSPGTRRGSQAGETDVFTRAPKFDFVQSNRREVTFGCDKWRQGHHMTSPIAHYLTSCCWPNEGADDRPQGKGSTTTLALTSLLSLRFLKISIHNHETAATPEVCHWLYLTCNSVPASDTREDLTVYGERSGQVKVRSHLRPQGRCSRARPAQLRTQ